MLEVAEVFKQPYKNACDTLQKQRKNGHSQFIFSTMNSRVCVCACLFVFSFFLFLFVCPKSTAKTKKHHEISSISFDVFSFLGKLIEFYYSSSYYFLLLFVCFVFVCMLSTQLAAFCLLKHKKNIYTYTNKLITNIFFLILFAVENAFDFDFTYKNKSCIDNCLLIFIII